jgi:hypothetical protein
MYSQKHGKRQLSIGISFTNWFTQMFDDLLEPSHLLSCLQPIDLGRFHCMCHGPRLRSPKGCKSNLEVSSSCFAHRTTMNYKSGQKSQFAMVCLSVVVVVVVVVAVVVVAVAAALLYLLFW